MKTTTIRRGMVILFAAFLILFTATQPALSQSPNTPNATSAACLTMLESGAHHLGNKTVSGWEVPNPEGLTWETTFDSTATSAIVLRFETYDTNNSFVRVNGEKVITLALGGASWKYSAVVIRRDSLMQTGNKIRFESSDVATGKDEFMFRNVGLVTCYAQIDLAAQHIGDTTRDYWIISSPQGTSLSVNFNIPEAMPPIAVITMDMFDNTITTKFAVNGTQVGTVKQTAYDYWVNQAVVVMGGTLKQANNLVITPGLNPNPSGPEGVLDDFMIKNVRIYYETRASALLFLPKISSNSQ